jgi:hypothetical protein
MVIVQGILELLRRSLGRVFQSIFGWSVHVLFGAVAREEKTLLAAAVAAAATWPVLAVGSVFPRAAAFVLAFVPLPRSVPAGLLRAGWIVLALAVPLFVGWVVQKRSADGYSLRRILSGFPITLGIAAAFLVAFFVVPVQKLAALVRGEKADFVPLIVEEPHRDAVGGALRKALAAAGLALKERVAPRLQRVISAILRATSVAAGRGDAAPPRYYGSERLSVTIHPNGVDLRGRPSAVLLAHAVIAERATELPTLQTTDPEAQELESRIRRCWAGRPEAPAGSRRRELRSLARELPLLDCPFEEWEIVYRQVLQLHLALAGEAQLLTGGPGADPLRRDAPRPALLRRRTARAAGLRVLDKTTQALAGLARRLPGAAYRLWRRR